MYVFFNPQKQVKSADTKVYDDSGNLIPLSERFDPNKDDIRWSKEITPDMRKEKKLRYTADEMNYQIGKAKALQKRDDVKRLAKVEERYENKLAKAEESKVKALAKAKDNMNRAVEMSIRNILTMLNESVLPKVKEKQENFFRRESIRHIKPLKANRVWQEMQ